MLSNKLQILSKMLNLYLNIIFMIYIPNLLFSWIYLLIQVFIYHIIIYFRYIKLYLVYYFKNLGLLTKNSFYSLVDTCLYTHNTFK